MYPQFANKLSSKDWGGAGYGFAFVTESELDLEFSELHEAKIKPLRINKDKRYFMSKG